MYLQYGSIEYLINKVFFGIVLFVSLTGDGHFFLICNHSYVNLTIEIHILFTFFLNGKIKTCYNIIRIYWIFLTLLVLYYIAIT